MNFNEENIKKGLDVFHTLIDSLADDDEEKFNKLQLERPALADLVIYMLDDRDLVRILKRVAKEAGIEIQE